MKKITAANQLKEIIELLEIKHTLNEELLKDQFRITYNSLKPVNIIKNTISDIFTSPAVTNSILGSVVGIISGYFTKKVAVGDSHNKVREVLGTVLQLGVTNIVSGHPEIIVSIINYISTHLFHKKETNTVEEA